MAESYVTGGQEAANKILRYLDKKIDGVSRVVELTSVDVANHAKSEHIGVEAHARNRYANVTSTLTRSISQRLFVSPIDIIGTVFTNVQYGPDVEFGRRSGIGYSQSSGIGYPFMFPALRANENKFKVRLSAELKKF